MDYAIGEKIKSLRIKNKLSQDQLCGEALNRVVLSRIENNKSLPSIDQLEYISTKLNVPITYFFIKDNDLEDLENQRNESILGDIFSNKSYLDIIKFQENNTSLFNSITDLNKYYYLGMSFFYLSIYPNSTRQLKRFVNQYTRQPENFQKKNIYHFASALNILFQLMLKNSNIEKATHYLYLATIYLLKYDYMNHLISYGIHSNLAYAYLEMNNFKKAINLLEVFLANYNDLKYIDVLDDMYIILNISYFNTGDYDKAIKYIKKSIYLYLYQEKIVDAGECYFNMINALRFNKKFDKALNVIDSCKIEFPNEGKLYYSFLIEEIMVYFNLNRIDYVIKLSKSLSVSNMSSMSKANLYFMLGHAYFNKSDFIKSKYYLFKCEKFFIKEKYFYDLNILYSDLYEITKDDSYKDKSIEFRNKVGRKNIVVY